MCGGGGREGGRERERERTSGLSQSVKFFFSTYFVSCNGPCAPKEKWHRKEHIIIILSDVQVGDCVMSSRRLQTVCSDVRCCTGRKLQCFL